MRISPRQVLIVVLLSFGLTALWLAVLPIVPASGVSGDARHYLGMAADPHAIAFVPFAYRVLTPWLAHAIGGESHYADAFRFITFTALTASGPAVYLICRRMGGPHAAGLVSAAGLLCLPGWLFNIYQPYLMDGTAMALTAWSVVALIFGWFTALPLLLTALAFARETVMGLALPMYMWLRTQWVDWPVAGRVALLIAPALLAGWVVRQPLGSGDRWDIVPGFVTGSLLRTWRTRIETDPAWWLLYGFAASLGIWWILALCGRAHGGRLWWLLLPVFGQFAFGGDWSRFAMYAFPVVIPAGAIAVWRHPRRGVLLALVGAQSVAVVADLAANGAIRLNQWQPSTSITVGLAGIAALVLGWTRLRGSRSRARSGPHTRPDETRLSTREQAC